MQYNYGHKKQMDVLVIDEISMVSKNIFEQVECVVGHVKNNFLAMGGVQTILCGNILQLPPVLNHLLEDDGVFCFQSSVFNKVSRHKVSLSKQRRTVSETDYLNVSTIWHGGHSRKKTCLS